MAVGVEKHEEEFDVNLFYDQEFCHLLNSAVTFHLLYEAVAYSRCMCSHGHVCVFVCQYYTEPVGVLCPPFPRYLSHEPPGMTSGQRYRRRPCRKVAGSLPV